MTPSNACTTVMAIPRNAIAMRERIPIAIRTVSNKATLREAAYRAKVSSLPGPSRPAREKPELTPALRSVVRAQLQNLFVIESPFVSLILRKSTALARECLGYDLSVLQDEGVSGEFVAVVCGVGFPSEVGGVALDVFPELLEGQAGLPELFQQS